MKQKIGIGLDLGGTSLKYVLGDSDGHILLEKKRPSQAKAKNSRILNLLNDSIAELIDAAQQKHLNAVVIGVGTPGSIDVEKGYLFGATPNFKYWKNVAIAEQIEDRFNLPVFVDNDANLMALAEARYGTGKGYKDLICLTIGTGIGGGIILGNKVYRGHYYGGSEIGHMSIRYDGIKCRCGGRGCLEKYASASAMIQYFQRKNKKKLKIDQNHRLSVRDIFKEYFNGNPAAEETIDRATYFLGRGIASLLNIFNPQMVILGGGVADAGRVYIDKVTETAFAFAMPNSRKKVKIVKARLGNKAGMIGAITHGFEQLIERSERKR